MRILMLLGVAWLVTGCSQTATDSAVRSKTVVDEEYMAAVEQVARNSSVDVVWVHPPTKKIADKN